MTKWSQTQVLRKRKKDHILITPVSLAYSLLQKKGIFKNVVFLLEKSVEGLEYHCWGFPDKSGFVEMPPGVKIIVIWYNGP